jgi:uncharacterized protein (UPF0276 family)
MSVGVLGVGMVYVPGIEPLLETHADLVHVLEIEPQTIWIETDDPENPYRPDPHAFARLMALPQAKIVHGVGFPVGGSQPPDPRHLAPLCAMIDGLDAAWASEHLSFNKATGPDGEFKTGFLLPPRQTRAGIAAAVRSIGSVAPHLPVPFAVETGVNYLRPRSDELPDGLFVGAIAREANCGILLDLHNVWTNERNGRQPVVEYLTQLPLERVWEVHVAGGAEFRGYWLDAHSGAIPDPLYALAEEVIPQLPNLRALIFEMVPADLYALGIDGVRTQLERLHRLWEYATHTPSWIAPVGPLLAMNQDVDESEFSSSAAWENALGALVVGRPVENQFSTELAQDPGVDLIHTLVCEFRAGMVVQALQLTSRLLLLTLGDAGFRALLEAFWREAPPRVFKAPEGEAFASFIEERKPNVPYITDVLAFERAVMASLINGTDHIVPFPYDPLPLLRALAAGRLPDPELLTPGRFQVEVTAENDANLTVEGVLFGSASGWSQASDRR